MGMTEGKNKGFSELAMCRWAGRLCFRWLAPLERLLRAMQLGCRRLAPLPPTVPAAILLGELPGPRRLTPLSPLPSSRGRPRPVELTLGTGFPVLVTAPSGLP